MSRLEYNDELQETISYDIRPNIIYSKCSYCREPHVKDQVGLLSVKLNIWFCSGSCMTLYNYDNQLVTYTPETVAVILDMKKKFYSQRKSKRNRVY